jgi:hypothetical protein
MTTAGADADAGGHQRLADGAHDDGVAGRLGRAELAELEEGLDDADDGAEQAEQRRDVADGDQAGEAGLVAGPLGGQRAEHGLLHRLAAPLAVRHQQQAGPQHVARQGVALDQRQRRRHVVAAERRRQRGAQGRETLLRPQQQQGAVDHHRRAEHRDAQQQPGHPLGAVVEEFEELLGQHGTGPSEGRMVDRRRAPGQPIRRGIE